jgi:predicted MPP superfamily phosphohydrolase
MRTIAFPNENGVLSILQLTDLHLAPGDFTGQNPRIEMLDKRLSAWCETTEDGLVDVIAVTGDIIDNSLVDDDDAACATLGEAGAWLRGFADKKCRSKTNGLIVVPGNHDLRLSGIFNGGIERNSHPFWKEFSNETSHLLASTPGFVVQILAINSVVPHSTVDLATGYVAPEQLANLPAARRGAGDELFRVALMHHNPLPVIKDEVEHKLSLLEKLLKQRLVGAPELMLLRNSGQTLSRLLEQDIQLILHGHFHKPSYWRVANSSSDVGMRDLEVISSGASCVPAAARPTEFNHVMIMREGFLKAQSISIRDDGAITATDFPTQPYEAIRGRRAKMLRGVCKEKIHTYIINWTIDMVSGISQAEVHCKGISPGGDIPMKTLRLFGYGTALGFRRIAVTNATAGYEVVVDIEQSPQNSPSKNEFRYSLSFTPAIEPGNACDVSLMIEAQGTFFLSLLDQTRMSTTNEALKGYDEVGFMAHPERQYEQVSLRAHLLGKFVGEGNIREVRLPHGIELGVIEYNGREAKREKSYSGLVMSYTDQYFLQRLLARQVKELVLVVKKPLPGHVYRTRWSLGKPANENFSGASKKVREILKHRELRDARSAQSTQIVAVVRHAIEQLRNENQDSSKCGVYVFALDESGLLVCWGFDKAGLVYDGVEGMSYRYGSGVVGLAFRIRSPAWCKRGGDGFSERFDGDDFPENLSALLAIPVQLSNVAEDPVCVVAISALKNVSLVTNLIQNEEACQVFVQECTSKVREQLLLLDPNPER